MSFNTCSLVYKCGSLLIHSQKIRKRLASMLREKYIEKKSIFHLEQNCRKVQKDIDFRLHWKRQ
jgi:hypothetical protein